MKKVLSHDPLAKKTTYFVDDGGEYGTKTVQDVTNITDQNQRTANDWKPGSMIGNTQKHHQKVAEIPATLYFDLLKKFGDPKHNLKKWKRWLNDNENRHFRTTGGRV